MDLSGASRRAQPHCKDIQRALTLTMRTGCLSHVYVVTARSALREKHTKDLEAAEGALKDAKADRKESERDRRLAAAVDQLKRNIVGAAPVQQGPAPVGKCSACV